MEFQIPKSLISLSFLLWLAAVAASDPEEVQVTTEGFQYPTYETTTNVTESPDDNGMAIPQEPNTEPPPTGPQSKEEDPPPQTGVVAFPDNHKNFTPSHYPGDQDSPPYYNHLNTYQQQYKNYNEQKQMYSRKPIKFEENVLTNYYLPHNPDGRGDKKTGNVRVNRNPFPYAFENDRNRESWYRGEGHDSVHMQSVLENDKAPEEWYGQQNLLPGHQQSYKVMEKTPEDWFRHQGSFPEHQQSYKQTDKAPEEWYGQQNLLPGRQQSYQRPEKTPDEWYKHTGLLSTHEKPNNEYVLRGHKDTGLSYHVYPHEDKFFHKEILHFDHHHPKKDEKGAAWKKVFHVLTALVPLGLLLASLSPNVISINSTSTTKTTRQRSEDAPPARFKEEDVVKLMKKYGVESLSEAQCEDRILCELAVEGGKSSAGPIEKGFWFLANETPWDIAEKAGMNDLFKAIKGRKCETYKCHGKVRSTGDSSLGKKLVWKSKMK